MDIDSHRTVGDLAAALPRAAEVFERLHIDYCCNGSRRLVDACAEAGISPDLVRAQLLAAHAGSAPGFVDWSARPAPELVEHITATHHVYTRESLARIERLMGKVLATHGAAHPELEAIGSAFEALRDDLLPHMLKEERVLFPYVLAMSARRAAGMALGAAPFGTVRNPIQMMNREHERAGTILAELAARTGDYTAPAEACATWRALYAALAELQADLHRHIHLESHVLFPRAERMERGA